MIKHFCDKCGSEVSNPHNKLAYEFCDKCHSKLEEVLEEVVEDFVSGELESSNKQADQAG